MQVDDFKSVISTFADPGSDMLFERAKVIFSMNGQVIDISITSQHGNILVDEGNGNVDASLWIIKRLANLPLLANRLKERITPNDCFVSPKANILETLESKPEDNVNSTNDALTGTLNVLNDRCPLETSILYITSDAGEGKTSLINEMASYQAKLYSEGKTDWLLVPIPLGGRHFLRFDDITVGALQNRYRFPFLYYNSFLALVRMGVIVPAFDGFEEMFVENSSGEALSAMGILVGALDSTGAVVVAARKAYFEFENLKAQEKLYDSISNYDVGFGKIEIQRWSRDQFLEYCKKRNFGDGEKVYNHISDRLKPTHSLLTRPVLVRRLLDIAIESTSLDHFLEKIYVSGADFFSVFVRGIIDREANDKWIDRSGEVGSPLLSADEHCELLSYVAMGMWEARVDYLKLDHLDFVADYFCESKRKTPLQTQQIRDRLKGHALLIASTNSSSAVEFDHDEFRLFFLGEGFAEQLKPLTDRAKIEVLGTLRRGILPEQSQIAFLRSIKRNHQFDIVGAAKLLIEVAGLDGQASYTHENCSRLIIKLISGLKTDQLNIDNLTFGIDALRDCNLTNVNFKNCYFSPSSLELTELENCSFNNCKFGQLKIYNTTTFKNCKLINCEVDTLHFSEKNIDIWDPATLLAHLKNLGFVIQSKEVDLDTNTSISLSLPIDEELHDFEKLLRYFMRSTHIGESVILIKLGERGQGFIDRILPELLESNVLLEIENLGGKKQRRFKLGQPLEKLNKAISSAQGSYSKLLDNFKQLKRD